MTEKQLRHRIGATKEALAKEKRRNAEKMSRVGWGSGFRRQYVGPCCRREHELEDRLRRYERELAELVKGGEAV